MCGRYGSWSTDGALAEAFGAATTPELEDLGPSWNVAPGADVRVVVERFEDAPGGAPDPDPDGDPAVRRELRVARWGLLPSWARDPRAAYRAFNARSETVADKPTFRAALRRFRCLVPADCWYEWRKDAPGGGAGKTPFAVRSETGGPLALAGLCSWWRLPGTEHLPQGLGPDEVPLPDGVRPGPAVHGTWLLTTTVLTRPAGEDLTWLHEREPVVLGRADAVAWLDPRRGRPEVVTALLGRPRPPLAWYEVDRRVGSTRVDGPALAAPTESGGAQPPGAGAPYR